MVQAIDPRLQAHLDRAHNSSYQSPLDVLQSALKRYSIASGLTRPLRRYSLATVFREFLLGSYSTVQKQAEGIKASIDLLHCPDYVKKELFNLLAQVKKEPFVRELSVQQLRHNSAAAWVEVPRPQIKQAPAAPVTIDDLHSALGKYFSASFITRARHERPIKELIRALLYAAISGPGDKTIEEIKACIDSFTVGGKLKDKAQLLLPSVLFEIVGEKGRSIMEHILFRTELTRLLNKFPPPWEEPVSKLLFELEGKMLEWQVDYYRPPFPKLSDLYREPLPLTREQLELELDQMPPEYRATLELMRPVIKALPYTLLALSGTPKSIPGMVASQFGVVIEKVLEMKDLTANDRRTILKMIINTVVKHVGLGITAVDLVWHPFRDNAPCFRPDNFAQLTDLLRQVEAPARIDIVRSIFVTRLGKAEDDRLDPQTALAFADYLINQSAFFTNSQQQIQLKGFVAYLKRNDLASLLAGNSMRTAWGTFFGSAQPN
jgi:hypothetical protein